MKNTLSILFTGDFAPCRRFEKIVLAKKETIFGDALPLIQNADISFVNLECPLTNSAKPIEKSGPAIKADPKCVEVLKDFTIIGLANNHVMDFDTQGLEDTIEACESLDILTVGAGSNINEAQKFKIVERNGVKVAFIALAEHEFNQASEYKAGSAPIDAIDNYHQIMQAKKQADILIVTLHAGNEYFPYPRPKLRKLCHHYIDLGVEAVVCHHPHVPGAYEYYNGKPIFYSIGNFIFDNEKPPKEWDKGYMVRLDINKQHKSIENIELIPFEQSVQIAGIKLLRNEEKDNFLQQIESYKEILENKILYKEVWKEFVEKQANSYILRQYSPLLFRGLGFLGRNTSLSKIFVNNNNILAKLNILRCQSHHELLEAALELKND
jgi:hypothetical protein